MGNRAAGSLGYMESSLVSLLDVGSGSCHPLRTADPTAVAAGRLLGDKQLRMNKKRGVAVVSVLYRFWLKFSQCLLVNIPPFRSLRSIIFVFQVKYVLFLPRNKKYRQLRLSMNYLYLTILTFSQNCELTSRNSGFFLRILSLGYISQF